MARATRSTFRAQSSSSWKAPPQKKNVRRLPHRWGLRGLRKETHLFDLTPDPQVSFPSVRASLGRHTLALDLERLSMADRSTRRDVERDPSAVEVRQHHAREAGQSLRDCESDLRKKKTGGSDESSARARSTDGSFAGTHCRQKVVLVCRALLEGGMRLLLQDEDEVSWWCARLMREERRRPSGSA